MLLPEPLKLLNGTGVVFGTQIVSIFVFVTYTHEYTTLMLISQES